MPYTIKFLKEGASAQNAVLSELVAINGDTDYSDIAGYVCNGETPTMYDDLLQALSSRKLPPDGVYLLAVYKKKGKGIGRPSQGKRRIDVTLTDEQIEYLNRTGNRSEFIGALIDSQINLNRTHKNS